MSLRDRAGNVAGVAFLVLMFCCFVYLTHEGGKFLWGDFTTGIAETQKRMDRDR